MNVGRGASEEEERKSKNAWKIAKAPLNIKALLEQQLLIRSKNFRIEYLKIRA
jgi:hypothetical protein